jgi:hypothetical protein
VLAVILSSTNGAEEVRTADNPHRLIVPGEFSGDLPAGKTLVISSSIEMSQEVAILAIEPDRKKGVRPVCDATASIVSIKVDSNFVGSGSPLPPQPTWEL